MKYTEVKQDLFKVDRSWYLAHCISADAKMGAGIAVQFKKRFNLNQLYQMELYVGQAVLIDRVFNLITKPLYWQKPTYDTLKTSLIEMRHIALRYDIEKIAMPAIGAGLDRLNWNKNREIIKDVFKDTDIEILVCML